MLLRESLKGKHITMVTKCVTCFCKIKKRAIIKSLKQKEKKKDDDLLVVLLWLLLIYVSYVHLCNHP